MKEVLNFLREIRVNNNRPWFEENKPRYRKIQSYMNALALELIEGISGFDPSVIGLTEKDCTYRIYRDVRFSPNKDPYKTHIGIYVCPKGKKSEYAGYYMHIEPGAEGSSPGHFISAGIYMPSPDILRSTREEISDNWHDLEHEIKKAKGFRLSEENKLKKLPAGFTAGNDYDEYLKHKDFYLVKSFGDDYLLREDFASAIVEDFRKTAGFMRQLNRAVEYALEMRGQ